MKKFLLFILAAALFFPTAHAAFGDTCILDGEPGLVGVGNECFTYTEIGEISNLCKGSIAGLEYAGINVDGKCFLFTEEIVPDGLEDELGSVFNQAPGDQTCGADQYSFKDDSGVVCINEMEQLLVGYYLENKDLPNTIEDPLNLSASDDGYGYPGGSSENPFNDDPENIVGETNERTATTVSLGLAEQVASFYTYALGIGALIALGVILYGGFLYSASAGNPTAVGEAKKWIQHAIFGLILLFSSFIFLNFLNPDLTTLDELLIEQNPDAVAPAISSFEGSLGDPDGLGLDQCHAPRNELSASLAANYSGDLVCPFYTVNPMFTDSWCQYRDQTKYHAGTDMFVLKEAAPGNDYSRVPLRAIEAGTIFRTYCDTENWTSENKIGGVTLHLKGAVTGTLYYYGHLHSCAPNIQVGSVVGKGQIVGFLGDTGNAKGTPPHLHLGVRAPGSSQTALDRKDTINPYPMMRALCAGPPSGCREDCESGEWGNAAWYCRSFPVCGGSASSGGVQQCEDRCAIQAGQEFGPAFDACMVNCGSGSTSTSPPEGSGGNIGPSSL